MKRSMSVLVALVLIAGLLMTGCGGGTGANTGSEAPAPETYNISFTFHGPESISISVAFLEGLAYAEEQSGGRIKFTSYWGSTFVTWEDTIASIGQGVVDTGYVDIGMISENFELNEIFGRPSESVVIARPDVAKVYNRLIEEFPELNEELKSANIMWLAAHCLGGYHLVSSNSKDIIHPQDLAGLTIDSMGDTVNYIASLGASAVSMDPSDYYISLERNTVDGNFNCIGSHNAYALMEVAKTVTVFGSHESSKGGGVWAPGMGMMVNIDSWNSWPSDVQKWVKEGMEYGLNALAESDYVIESEWMDRVMEAGIKVNVVDDATRAEWGAAMVDTNQEWVAKLERQGFNSAADIYARLKELMGEYKPLY